MNFKFDIESIKEEKVNHCVALAVRSTFKRNDISHIMLGENLYAEVNVDELEHLVHILNKYGIEAFMEDEYFGVMVDAPKIEKTPKFAEFRKDIINFILKVSTGDSVFLRYVDLIALGIDVDVKFIKGIPYYMKINDVDVGCITAIIGRDVLESCLNYTKGNKFVKENNDAIAKVMKESKSLPNEKPRSPFDTKVSLDSTVNSDKTDLKKTTVGSIAGFSNGPVKTPRIVLVGLVDSVPRRRMSDEEYDKFLNAHVYSTIKL